MTNPTGFGFTNMKIGADGAGNLINNGLISEIIFFGDDRTSARTASIESINAYYGAYS